MSVWESAARGLKLLGRLWTAGLEKGGHNAFPDGLTPRPAPPAPMGRLRTRFDPPMKIGDSRLWSRCGLSCGCTIGECPYTMEHYIENQRAHWAARRAAQD